MSASNRAAEIAEFLGRDYEDCLRRLALGFSYNHVRVKEDFNHWGPKNDTELLDWYRNTEEYIWELSAYHEESGFNYVGMCGGIGRALRDRGMLSVLCLGDGIGDLTIDLYKMGLESVYHDLAYSKTARFAEFRYKKQTGNDQPKSMSYDWNPRSIAETSGAGYDAIVSLDFLEHVHDLPKWTEAIYDSLKIGGMLFCQNAFDCGSGHDGSIPMHLTENDKYAHAAEGTNGASLFDHMLSEMGLKHETNTSNWYVKA